jgi:hypothetical protein
MIEPTKRTKITRNDIDQDYSEYWKEKLKIWNEEWRKELNAGKRQPTKLRADLMRRLVSPEGFHIDKASCKEGWDRCCPNDEDLIDFIREVAQCKAWLRWHLSDFEEYKKDNLSSSSFASHWRGRIEAHAHDCISVGAVIAAALSLSLVVKRDGWGCYTDNGYFDANIYARPVARKTVRNRAVAHRAA